MVLVKTSSVSWQAAQATIRSITCRMRRWHKARMAVSGSEIVRTADRVLAQPMKTRQFSCSSALEA